MPPRPGAGFLFSTAGALPLGTKDARLLYPASLVSFRDGDATRAEDFLRRAAEANPKFNDFHVHR